MIRRAKKVVFGHFLKFGLSDWLDIAHRGSTKYSTTCATTTRSWRVIQKSQKCIFEWFKEQKTRFLAVFLSLVCWINLISHIVIVINVCQHVYIFRQCYQIVKNIQKSQKMHLWMIQSVKKEVFGHYLDFGMLDQLDIAYCDSTKCFLTFGNIARSWRIIQKAQNCISEWSKEPKKRLWPFSWVWSVGSTWYCILW